MTAKVLLHVHEHPEGRVVVTPVDFPRLSVDADSYHAAHAAAVSRVTRQLRGISGSLRSGLSRPVAAELEVAEVALPAGKKGAKPPRITVGLVIVLRPTSQGEVYVVRAPEVPDFEVAVADRERARPAAESGLKEAFAHWELSAVLACDQMGSVRLETVELPFPPASEADAERDDAFLLEDAADDLTLLAAEQRLGRLDRRDALVDRVLSALSASGRASVMLVGPPDVGKTALLHELAARLASGSVPPPLRGRPLWRLSANELIAGAQYMGMWQDRARSLVARGRADRAIFAMGDPTAIVDAGRWRGSDNNLARYLRTYVESGDLTLICECTPEVLAATQKKEASFVDSFHRVDVPEPSVEAAREILTVAARRLEEAQSVAIAPDAVAAAVELTRRFEPYRGLPGKAVRLLEEATRATATSGRDDGVRRESVVATFAARTGLPHFLLSDETPMLVEEARAFFEQRVLGQVEAVTAVIDVVAVAKAGLNDPGKPLGSFFFVGPTGVGKTELTKALAEYLFGSRERVVRFDMGEYGSADAVQRLVGTAWRSEGEGELTRRVREQPFCVVLLDEIEKAHRDVYDALLAALGEGRMTDANGRTADFRNAIVIMTSNLGATRRQAQAVGFSGDGGRAGEAERLKRHFVEEAERFLRPEFFNRIDRVIAFRALDQETVRTIARRELGRLLLREGIARRRLLVEIDDPVVERLAEAGFHPRYGARPLQREIERAVIQPLARLIVEQRPGPGDLVRFTRDDAEIRAAVRKAAPPEQRKPRLRRADATREASLARAERQAEELFEQVTAERDAALVRALADQRSALVGQTNQPSFWDEPDLARATLARLYQVERALERLDHIGQRAEGLRELARQMRRNRDRRRLAELRQAVGEVEEELLVVRLELAGASAGGDRGSACLRVVPVGSSDGWAEALLSMYAAWAERTGRPCERLAEHPHALRVDGLSTFELLARETGLHRRTHGDEVQLARVLVEAVDGEQTASRPHDAEDIGEVVRIYGEGRRQFVRDPRTGVRVGDVASVLDHGRIDDFLVAAVRLVRGSASS
jgi:ATP-dependent Clp protease ATP-binding subunit ClpA